MPFGKYFSFSLVGEVVVGEVHLWGTVIEHEEGWRAEYAYPKALFLAPHVDVGIRIRETLRTEHGLAPLTAYGVDIFLHADDGDVLLWSTRSGYRANGLKRLADNERRFRRSQRNKRLLLVLQKAMMPSLDWAGQARELLRAELKRISDGDRTFNLPSDFPVTPGLIALLLDRYTSALLPNRAETAGMQNARLWDALNVACTYLPHNHERDGHCPNCKANALILEGSKAIFGQRNCHFVKDRPRTGR